MLEKLTNEQEEKIPFYLKKWLDIGLSTDEVDIDKCISIVSSHYKNLGLKQPKEFYIKDSPSEAIDFLVSKFGLNKTSVIYNFCYGSHDAGWLSYYDFFLNETNVKISKDILPLIELAKECGWWSPYEDVVVFQQRPCEINMEDGVVQCSNGPAIKYRDGFCIYIIDGIRLNEQIVMRPETLSLHQINSETDLDKRSIMIERFGWDRFIKESKAECLDKRHNLVENTKEALFKTELNGNRLIVTCPTGRVFSLGVPSDVKTCESAQSWLGNEEEKINVIART